MRMYTIKGYDGMKRIRPIAIIIAAMLLASCAAPAAPEATGAPPSASLPVTPASATPTPGATTALPPAVDTTQYDAYSSARRQITRNYSESVGNYTRTFGGEDTIELPGAEKSDPYINISVPMLIDADRGVLEEILSAPLAFASGGDALSAAYTRVHASLKPFETAYKAAQQYYLDGDAQEDSFARAQELHTAMMAASKEYSAALEEFSAQMRALDKLRREQRLNALKDRGRPVRYQVEGMLAYGDDIEVFLSAFGDSPYHEADAAAFKALCDKFFPFAEAVAAFTEEDLLNDGFNEEFTHMFPNFFEAAIKARVIAKNALAIMQARSMDAELEPLPPEISSVGMDPAMAVSGFEENLATVSKLYHAFTAEQS